MKVVYSALFFATLFIGLWGVTTQPMVTAIVSKPPMPNTLRLETHVKKLSQEFHPRSFEFAGNTEKTVQYIAQQFE
jgi:hypothetical protein